MLANLTIDNPKNKILVQWLLSLLRSMEVTLWNKEPDDASLEESDRLLFAFLKSSDRIAHLQKGMVGTVIKSGWKMPKMFETTLFRPATERNGHYEYV
jgi:hypothetical protein